MDDLTGRLQSLLTDPESMQNLAELAAMLGGGDPADGDAAAPDSAAAPPPVDLTKLMAVGQAMGAMKDDENTALLLALRPHLSPQRQARVTRAVQLLRLLRVAAVLRENGLLDDILPR